MDKAKILIVDDTPKNIQILGTILRKNYSVYVAQNGQQAIETTKKIMPDLILMDIMMPEMDGFEACQHLKNNPSTQKIPIIFLTAKVESEDIIKGFELGAVDYVTKPFNSAELIARVKTHLQLLFSQRALEASSREQKELVHILCHDLSNPLSSCLGAAEIIDESNLDDLKALILSAASNGLDIIKLVRQMRAMSDKKMTFEALKLSLAVQESIYILEHKIKQKQLTLKVAIDTQTVVFAERVSLVNSVIANLLTNAIKFSHAGNEIEINASDEDEYVIMKMIDHGIGMRQSLLEKIFDVSQTTSRPGTNGEVGTGFGMPLVKKFITAYHGKITVDSKDIREYPNEHGTTITLKLPSKAKA